MIEDSKNDVSTKLALATLGMASTAESQQRHFCYPARNPIETSTISHQHNIDTHSYRVVAIVIANKL